MFSKLILIMTVAAIAVKAQSSSGTASAPDASASSILSGISPCILACVIPAATQNNCTFTDASCVCASAQFQADAAQCLMAHCTAADIQAATGLQTTECSAAGITPTGSVTGVNTVPFTLASSGTAAPGSATSTPAASAPANTPTTPAGSTTGGAPATTSKASALSLVANSGVGAVFGAMLAGVLAL